MLFQTLAQRLLILALKLSCFKEPSSFSPSESRKCLATLLRRVWAFGRFNSISDSFLGFWLAGNNSPKRVCTCKAAQRGCQGPGAPGLVDFQFLYLFSGSFRTPNWLVSDFNHRGDLCSVVMVIGNACAGVCPQFYAGTSKSRPASPRGKAKKHKLTSIHPVSFYWITANTPPYIFINTWACPPPSADTATWSVLLSFIYLNANFSIISARKVIFQTSFDIYMERAFRLWLQIDILNFRRGKKLW